MTLECIVHKILLAAFALIGGATIIVALLAVALAVSCGGPEPPPEPPADTVEVLADTVEVPAPAEPDTTTAECPVAEPCEECPEAEAFTEHDLETCFADRGLGFLLCPVL